MIYLIAKGDIGFKTIPVVFSFAWFIIAGIIGIFDVSRIIYTVKLTVQHQLTGIEK
jgi:hypothetical protein